MFFRQLTRQAPRLIRSTVANSARRSMTTAGAQLRELAAQSPHVDVIRYEHKNLKFTLQHVDSHADSLASGLLDCGLVPGDVVLSWLPNHFAEQVCTTDRAIVLYYSVLYCIVLYCTVLYCNSCIHLLVPVPRFLMHHLSQVDSHFFSPLFFSTLSNLHAPRQGSPSTPSTHLSLRKIPARQKKPLQRL